MATPGSGSSFSGLSGPEDEECSPLELGYVEKNAEDVAGAAKDQHTLSHQLQLPAPSPEQHPAAEAPAFRSKEFR